MSATFDFEKLLRPDLPPAALSRALRVQPMKF